MSIEARSAFVIFSFNFVYSWIEPKTPVPDERTAFITLTYSCRIKELSAIAVSALMADMTSIGN